MVVVVVVVVVGKIIGGSRPRTEGGRPPARLHIGSRNLNKSKQPKQNNDDADAH